MPRNSLQSPNKSPKKSRPSTSMRENAGPSSNEYEMMLQEQQHQSQMQISTQEIEIERLKTTVIALNSKCTVVEDHITDSKTATVRFEESEVHREELQQHIITVSNTVKTDNIAHTDLQEELIHNIKTLNQQLESEKERQHQKDLAHRAQVDKMQVDFHSELQRVSIEMEQVRKTLTEEKEEVRATLTADREQVRLTLTTEKVNITNELNERNERERNQLVEEREQIRTELLELNKKITQEMKRENENIRLEKTNENEEQRKRLTQEREDIRLSLTQEMERIRQQLSEEKEQVRESLTTQMEQLRVEKDTRIADLEDQFEQYRVESTTTINTQLTTIQTLKSTVLKHESTIISLQEIIVKKEDVEAQLATAREHISQLVGQKEALQRDLENATDYILELEEKVYKANKTSLELLKQLKDAEVEIETLKQYIIDLKQRIAVYIPVKEDSIDKKLAEFINNYPERSKLKIMFMRESEGVYQFGTKRVAVKVEKDNIKIRVGGGYLSIDEFLDQYTPVELEKLERKDPLKRFSEKVAIQKTIVNAGVRESSPVRSPGRASPVRKTAV